MNVLTITLRIAGKKQGVKRMGLPIALRTCMHP